MCLYHLGKYYEIEVKTALPNKGAYFKYRKNEILKEILTEIHATKGYEYIWWIIVALRKLGCDWQEPDIIARSYIDDHSAIRGQEYFK